MSWRVSGKSGRVSGKSERVSNSQEEPQLCKDFEHSRHISNGQEESHHIKMCFKHDKKCHKERKDLKYITNPLKPDWKILQVVRKCYEKVSKSLKQKWSVSDTTQRINISGSVSNELGRISNTSGRVAHMSGSFSNILGVSQAERKGLTCIRNLLKQVKQVNKGLRQRERDLNTSRRVSNLSGKVSSK